MQIVRWIIGIVIFIALLFLSLQNADTAKLRFFNIATFEAPLIFVVLIAFACGVAAGLLAGAMRTARLKRQLNKLRKDHHRPAMPPAPHGAAPGATPGSGPGFEHTMRGDL